MRKLTLLFLISLSACENSELRTEATTSATAKKEIFKTGEVIDSVRCAGDASKSFSLFLPADYDTAKKYPLLIFYDPHGAGSLPLKKYHHLAEEFNVVMMGSNDSKNGMAPEATNQIASLLMQEASQHLSVTANISLAGFSGGAKVAMHAAANSAVISAVIYSGSVAEISSPTFFLFGIAGVNDMNYSDLISFDESLGDNPNRLLIEWIGKHEWPDSISFRDAFYLVRFLGMKNGDLPKDESLIKKFIAEKNAALKIAQANLTTQKKLNEEVIIFLSGIAEVSDQKLALQKLSANPQLIAAETAKKNSLAEESKAKQELSAALERKDLSWWKNEIELLSSGSAPMEKRLLGFISLACYSYTNAAIQQKNLFAAEKLLKIYRLADLLNADQAFFESCFFAMKGENELSVQSLQRAMTLGFSNKQKIKNEPALAPILNDERVQQLIH